MAETIKVRINQNLGRSLPEGMTKTLQSVDGLPRDPFWRKRLADGSAEVVKAEAKKPKSDKPAARSDKAKSATEAAESGTAEE